MIGKHRLAQGIVIRLFRAWSAQRDIENPSMARLAEIVAPLGLPDETAIACASLFDLIEGHLGRRLERECCCSQRLSRDERALLGVLEMAPSLGMAAGTPAVPHGLPGAIVWACFAVRRALGMPDRQPSVANSAGRAGECPFAHGEEPKGAVHRA